MGSFLILTAVNLDWECKIPEGATGILGRRFHPSVAQAERAEAYPGGICRPLPYHVALARRHAWIFEREGQWYVEPRHRNGVWVNGIPADLQPIKSGDRIRLAPSEIELRVSIQEDT